MEEKAMGCGRLRLRQLSLEIELILNSRHDSSTHSSLDQHIMDMRRF